MWLSGMSVSLEMHYPIVDMFEGSEAHLFLTFFNEKWMGTWVLIE